jgi:sortase A
MAERSGMAALRPRARTPGVAVRRVDEDDRRRTVLQLVLARARRNQAQSESDAPRARLGVRAIAVALMAIGTLALTDAAATLVWQEPISALYAKLRQDRLSGALARVERAPVTPLERRALVRLPDALGRLAYLARELRRHTREGSAVGRIEVPRIGARFVVVKGTSSSDLRGGPGIFEQTAFPGVAATTVIAGHRTTYLAPFRHIDALRRGNRILLQMPYARFTYTVVSKRVVSPKDVHAAVARVGYERLVLSACTPLFSAAKRLLVFARLTATVPTGAALRSGARTLPAGPQRLAHRATPRLVARL